MIVAQAGFRSVTTQLYFEGDPFLSPNDPCSSGCDSGDVDRIMRLEEANMSGVRWWRGEIDLVIATS